MEFLFAEGRENMSSRKSCKVIAYFSIIPVGQDSTSMGSYVASAIEAIKEVKGLHCEITPMGTLMESNSLEPIFEAVKVSHEAMADKDVISGRK